MEPCVAFYCYVAWHFPQCEQLLTAIFLQFVLLVFQFALYVAQQARLLVLQSVDNLVELLKCEVCHKALCICNVFGEQIPYYFRIAGAHHQAEHVALAALFLLLSILTVAAYEEDYYENHECHLYQYASVEHEQTYDGASCEGCSGCDEPTTDYAQHTCHTEHCALAAPCTVGKTRTHGNHECHVGC